MTLEDDRHWIIRCADDDVRVSCLVLGHEPCRPVRCSPAKPRCSRFLRCYVGVLALWPLARLFVEALRPAPRGEPLGVLLGQWQSAATQRALSTRWNRACWRRSSRSPSARRSAVVLTLTDVRAKAALTFVALLPLLVPSQITALAWIEFTGARQPDPEPARPGAGAGRDQPALFEMGHRAGHGHRASRRWCSSRCARGCAACRAI